MFAPFIISLLISYYGIVGDLPKNAGSKAVTASAFPVKVNKSLVLQLVNEVRKNGCQCGDTYYYPVPELTWNAQLELAALQHSSNMYQNNFFSHIAPDGSKG
ncbi:MAG TPA: CAP domain-containing protein, partial [Flavisolibacter sp.]|nr:CAP domain-containing protein [Flavisolibacter sp.]